MTEPERKFEEEIRRALCAASDLIIPSGDGLNKIRERTAGRPPALGWFLAYVAHLPRQLVRGGRVAASEVAATAHGYSSLGLVLAAARRWRGQARHVLRTPGIWVRPVLASATALLLVIAVTLSVPRLRQQVTAQLDSAFGSSSGSSSSGGGTSGGGGAQSNSAAPIGSQTTTHMPGRPFLATMPAGSTQCRDQGSGAITTTRHSGGTVAARTTTGAANSVGVAPPGYVGPEPVSLTCTPSTASTEQATAPPVTSVTTTPVTTPPVAATTPSSTTTPTSTPTTTPPATTSPATTPPTTTPPATTSPPATSTSSAGNTPAAPGTPPGG
jgi:hypothetical protein